MTCGIYMIQNLVNGKIYIGQAVDIEERWKNHKNSLRRNCHHNKHLQNSWNRDGEENFEFTVICECGENQLNTLEQYYIFELMSYDGKIGYNKSYGGGGCRATEETRKKLREAHKGEKNGFYSKHHAEETRKKISEVHKGKTISEEHKRKISKATKGEKNPMYGRCGESSPNYGKHRSEETRKRISEATKGKIRSEETRRNIGKSKKGENNPWYGKHLSEETRKKISEAKKIAVVQLTFDGELVNVYGSSYDAERNGFTQQHINKCCKGKRKTHGGYKWMYLHEYIAKMHPNIKTINLFGKTYNVNQEEVKMG